MLKRLIEVALPLKEVSEQSAREKSIRHGHISTLHIWWARRPLAACRAAVFASLIPDPDHPECPESFRTLVMDVLGRAEFKPKVLEPLTTAPVPVEAAPLSDTPRNRCLEFIKQLVRWENSNNPEYVEPARKLIAAAHKVLHPDLPAPRPDTYWVYVLKCNDDSFYIGQTDNIPRRLEDHRNGQVSWTKSRLPVELIHFESFPSREEAVEREKKLKTGFGRKWLKREYEKGRLARQAGAEGDAPKVLDPFAGGGAIPLEALRLGCEAHAIDLNPVAHLIELCTLVYPQKYGQPLPAPGSGQAGDSRPVPGYIKRLIAHNRAKKKRKGETDLFDQGGDDVAAGDLPAPGSGQAGDEIIPDVEITEAEYRQNPLAADVRYWAHWVLKKAEQQIGHLYPHGPDGSVRLAYLWAHTLKCPNPACAATVPLIKQLWLAKKGQRQIALRLVPKTDRVDFEIAEGPFSHDPSEGTIKLGAMRCPCCNQGVYDKSQIKDVAKKGIGLQPLCIVSQRPGESGRRYESPSPDDEHAFAVATESYKAAQSQSCNGHLVIPDELISRDFSWVLKPPMFGLTRWGDLYNPRQAVALATFAGLVREALDHISGEYATAVGAYLGLILGRMADKSAKQCRWNSAGEKLENVFGRQAIPMSWDYGEVNPFSGQMGDWTAHIAWVGRCIDHCSKLRGSAVVQRGSATKLPYEDKSLEAAVTDPPYYDAVPYADLSDFFYVWQKRAIGDRYPDLYRTPLTPKTQELVQQSEKVTSADRRIKTKEFFEEGMALTFQELHRTLSPHGVTCVMFAHKTTTAWESIISGLIRAGLIVTSSWPFHTEMKARLRGQGSAALASSVTIVCRKRTVEAGVGVWDDVRQELKSVSGERLDFFWNQSIRGADFFISAIGPALSVFGKYEQVTRLDGNPVTVGQFLDEVRALVTSYALTKILHTTHTATIDPESRFYVVWKWSYGDAKVPADESFKLAQALGIDTELMWDKTGVLNKSGENVQAVPVAKRMKTKNLGEPAGDGTPASLIDVLHRLCAFREKGDTTGMTEFLARSGHARNATLWLVAQAVSEILPDGEKEKQLMQGLLNQREQLEAAGREARLF